MPDGIGRRSLTSVMAFLEGIEFPCYKQDVIDSAEMNDAPEEVFDVLELLPDEQYESMSKLLGHLRSIQ